MAPAPSLQDGPGAAHRRRTTGRVLGNRYRVLSLLGEGGMGSVHLCEHAVLGRRFAVKVLRPDLARDPALVERFRNEAVAASRIGQENVVDVLDFGEEEDGALYYVMEALDGRSLAAVIREEHPLAIGRALALLEQVCRALAAAHAAGVVHRDVKPDNVFVVRRDDGSERAKVIDFGVSHLAPGHPAAGGAAEAGAIVGTPAYMAPEQGAGEPVDALADVYAAGVLAFELLTATLPIVAEGAIGTLLAHRTHAPDPPSRRRPDVPPAVDALVLRALAKRPGDRHPSMEALAGAVAAARARLGDEGAAAPAPDQVRARTGARRVRPALVAAAAVTMLGAALAGWAWRGAAARAGVAAEAAARATPPRPGPDHAAGPNAATARPPRPAPGRSRDRGGGRVAASGPADAAAVRRSDGGERHVAPGARLTPGSRPHDSTRNAAAVEGSRGVAPPDSAAGPRTPRDSHLEDPYASGGLKEDPFR